MRTLLITEPVRLKEAVFELGERHAEIGMAIGRDDKETALRLLKTAGDLRFEASMIIENGQPDVE